MIQLILAFSLALFASNVSAQSANLDSPVSRPAEAKLRMVSLYINGSSAVFEVMVQDASDGYIRNVNFNVPSAAQPSATIAGIFTAMDTARPGETGSVMRRANFRLLGYLVDNGYLTGVTLVP